MAKDSNKYIEFWESYLDDFLDIIKEGGISNAEIDKEDLIDIGDRALGNYSFRLDMIDGNVTNNISGNAVARDLYHVLSSSKDFVSIAKGKHIVFRLSKAFSLDIIVNNE